MSRPLGALESMHIRSALSGRMFVQAGMFSAGIAFPAS